MPVTDTEAAPQAMRQEDVAVLLALVMAIMLLHALAVGTYKSRRCAKRVPSETCSVVDLRPLVP